MEEEKFCSIGDNMCGQLNQTRPHCIPKDFNDKGIGFFVIKNLNNEIGLEKIKIEDISYTQAINQGNQQLNGENVIAFTFIPFGMEFTLPDGEKVVCEKGMFDKPIVEIMENTTNVNGQNQTPLKELIDRGIKQAMLDKDNKRRDALRVIKAEISRDQKWQNFKDEDVIRVIRKSIKNLEIINTDEAREEIKILEDYVPVQMTLTQIEDGVKEIITELGATSLKDMGKIIAGFNVKHVGKADGKIVADIIKKALSF